MFFFTTCTVSCGAGCGRQGDTTIRATPRPPRGATSKHPAGPADTRHSRSIPVHTVHRRKESLPDDCNEEP
jgi:hypothetical protein